MQGTSFIELDMVCPFFCCHSYRLEMSKSSRDLNLENGNMHTFKPWFMGAVKCLLAPCCSKCPVRNNHQNMLQLQELLLLYQVYQYHRRGTQSPWTTLLSTSTVEVDSNYRLSGLKREGSGTSVHVWSGS